MTTNDYLAALARTRATVSEATVVEFLDDITKIARLHAGAYPGGQIPAQDRIATTPPTVEGDERA